MKKLTRDLVVAVDFDGVIAEYNHMYGRWKGHNTLGVPKKGAAKYLKRLHDEGWTIIVYTSRPTQEQSHVKHYLHEFGIPHDAINQNINDWFRESLSCKIYAHVYLDDHTLDAINRRWNWRRVYWKMRWKHRRYYAKPDTQSSGDSRKKNLQGTV
jgi:hypothetical protein